MTTEQMLEILTDAGYKAYKKNSNGSKEARMLDRHEPVVIDGYQMSCWREYVIYRVAEHVNELVPGIQVEVELDGNNTTLHLELTDEQQRVFNNKLYTYLKEQELV